MARVTEKCKRSSKGPQKSYLERLYQDFPLDTIVVDGNLIFAEHWRNLRGKKQILVPIRNIPGSNVERGRSLQQEYFRIAGGN